MIDENDGVHNRVEHRYVTANQPGNRHENKQLVHHKSPPLALLGRRQDWMAISMPVSNVCGGQE
jgi:hypothetical protein